MSDYEKATQTLIDGLNLGECKTYSEVRKRIYEYLSKEYAGRVPASRISGFADDFTESACLTLNIPQDA